MENLAWFLLGAGFALGLRWLAGRKPPAPREPPTLTPAVEPSVETAAVDTAVKAEPPPALDPLARLSALVPALAEAGDACAHPSQLPLNPAFMDAVNILAHEVPLSTTLEYVRSTTWMVATAACAAVCSRRDREEAVPELERVFGDLIGWPMYYVLRCFTLTQRRPSVGSLALKCPEWAGQYQWFPDVFAEHCAARAALGDTASFDGQLETATPQQIANAEAVLRRANHPLSRDLLADLDYWRRRVINYDFLQSFGTFLDVGHAAGLLIAHAGIATELDAAEIAALTYPHRSLIVVGDPRSGKTSFVTLLAARAARRGWKVFEAGAASVMAGQTYFGQLEERLRRLTWELDVEKRVLWYVPDFLQLAASGTHQGQAASVLDQILPSIASGRLVLISELTPNALSRVLQHRPALRSTLEIVRLNPLQDADVHELAREFTKRAAGRASISPDDDVVDTATHLARHYLGSSQMPGAALDVIRLTVQRLQAARHPRLTRDDVLTTLTQMTGMPRLVLDDRERVDLDAIRTFFASRVLGQDEAVTAVIDRIAMLKAGLTDPGKPTAVFLFAGPTGTGKTELAKSLAEFLFGSPDRLIRLDMSEFQAVESVRKILGDTDNTTSDALTQRVRKQPFSVVLLDEFEKAHSNAWDLFLQVFDDGRLTDAAGQTVDFRHTIIILTSNLGSVVPQASGLGFVPHAGAFSAEHVMRAVHQSFRPEFVNRLDAIIVFRPLTRELMRGILGKELDRVLERRGLRHRDWAVEWESSALDFLVDKGFSPTMGARPLKRAIDRYLLAPLAATLVERRFPEGDQFLFVRSDGRGIQVEFVDPDAPSESPEVDITTVPEGLTLARMILQPAGTLEERAALARERQVADGLLQSVFWKDAEREVAEVMRKPEFWSDPGRFRVLARYALMDRVKAAAATAASLESRLERSAADGRPSRDLVSRLASQLHAVNLGIDDGLTDAPVEAVVEVQPVLDSSADPAKAAEWSARLLEMYRRWAAQRQMQWEDVPRPGAPPLLVVSGFGAAKALTAEAGLHLLEYPGRHEELDRVAARVKVAPTPDGPDDIPDRYAVLAATLEKTAAPAVVIRRYRLDGSPLVRDAARGWRTGRADLVLAGHFDLLPEVLRTAD